MWFKRFIFACLALLAFPAFSAGQIVGYIVYITLSEYKSTQSGTNAETGQPLYTASYTGNNYTLVKYVAGSTQPTYQSLGLVQYKDLQGNSPMSLPSSEYSLYLVTSLLTRKVKTEMSNVDYSPLGDLTRSHPLFPIYEGTDLPYGADDFGNYKGVNLSFGENGLNFLQGRVSPADGSAPQFYYYDPNSGDVIITDNPNSNMGTYTYDPETGALNYTAWQDPNGGSSGGSVDLSPVVNAINTQGGLTRDQLVALLGSAGNSWVYDCKLSLSQLYDLASTYYPQLSDGVSQLNVDVSSEVRNGSEMLVGAIEGINVSPVVNVPAPVVNVAAPNVTVNPAEVNIDTSTLAKESTLSDLVSKFVNYVNKNHTDLSAIHNDLYNYIRPMVMTIRDKMNTWEQNNDISISPPDFGDDSPNDDLPDGIKSYHTSGQYVSDAQSVLGDLVSWGSEGAPLAFDFAGVSSLLTAMVGNIPSVGSDSNMFDVDMDIPYVGHIVKHFTWNDIPFIGEFRTFLLWCLYVFFAIAIFKLVHKSVF